jgi:hypothetical protein
MGLPSATGLFSDMFDSMQSEIKRNPNSTNDYGTAGLLTTAEKRISFLNRYFVFRKTIQVNTEKIFKQMIKRDMELPTLSNVEKELFEETTQTSSKNIKIGKSKGKRVTILASSNEIMTTTSEPIPIITDTNISETPQPTKIMIKIPKIKKT